MPQFSEASLKQLRTCHADVQALMHEVIKYYDFTVLEGFRDEEAQNRAYAKGLSKARFPHSKHNTNPSLALDISPYPIDWSNKEAARQRFVYLAGYVMMMSKIMDIPLRWGGDWDGDQDTRDERFRDLGHFELRKKNDRP